MVYVNENIKNENMVSIIVPVYNCENYLLKCMHSIIAQTYTNLEIILVDDGSTDASGDICEEIASKDNRVTVIHKSNGGPASARNKGIDCANGSYIMFIDSDDFAMPQLVEELISVSILQKADLVVCGYYYIDENQEEQHEEEEYEMLNFEGNKKYQLVNGEYIQVMPFCKLYKREIFNELRYPEGKYAEDEWIIHHIVDKSNKIIYFNKKMYYYVNHKDTLSKQEVTEVRLRSMLDARWDRIHLIAEKKDLGQEALQNCVEWLQRYIVETYVRLRIDKTKECERKILLDSMKKVYLLTKVSRVKTKFRYFLFFKCSKCYHCFMPLISLYERVYGDFQLLWKIIK